MKTRTSSKPTPIPSSPGRRPALRPARADFRPDVQRLEERISLSALGLGGAQPMGLAGSNHNETLLRGRRSRRTGH
jgi:hypothetical protein